MFLICTAGVFIAAPGHGGDSVAEESISLDLTQEPLGQVLDEIAAATGYRIIFDESWDNFPISASFKDEPLHRGLKRILRNLNNAVIYGSDRTIKIMIYDEAQAPETPSNRSREQRPPAEPGPQVRSYRQKPMSLPAPRETQEEATVEDDSRSADENKPPDGESDAAAAENEEQKENEPGGSAEEVGENTETEQNEDASGEDEKSTAETESAGN